MQYSPPRRVKTLDELFDLPHLDVLLRRVLTHLGDVWVVHFLKIWYRKIQVPGKEGREGEGGRERWVAGRNEHKFTRRPNWVLNIFSALSMTLSF